MPELPEVETSRRGIRPYLVDQQIEDIIIRQPKLRWPIPADIKRCIPGQVIRTVERRGKYLIISTDVGHMILHLGMSGNLRIVPTDTLAEKHDHVDLLMTSELSLRFTDPRRFGCLLWTTEDPYGHPLLEKLGPEPLSKAFNLDYLYPLAKKSQRPIKTLIMDSHVVVGVGNIYASESLFMSGIHPKRIASKVSAERLEILIESIKTILKKAIKVGGTTLKDFRKSDGKPGYFKQQLQVYGRNDLPCSHCETPIKQIQLGQRSTYYCPQCQR